MSASFLAAVLDIEIKSAGPLGSKAVREAAVTGGADFAADSVEAMYRGRGYLLVEATTSVDTSTGGDIRLIVDVNAGPRSVIVDYRINGYPFKLPSLGLKTTDPFFEALLYDDMERLITELENSGYPFAKIALDSLQIGPIIGNSLPVEILLSVDIGDPVAIEQVILQKKARTRPIVVQRLMLIDPPESFSQIRIDKGVRRVNDMSWLSVVGEPELLLDESGKWLLRVTVSEDRAVLINGILGYAPGSEGGNEITGHLDAAFRNMWGTGRSLSILWDQMAGSNLRIGASYTEPWAFGGSGDLSLSGEYYGHDSTYSERSFAADYSLPLSFDFNISFGAGYRGVSPDSLGQNVYKIPRSNEYSAKFGAELDKLRPKLNPRGGFRATANLAPSYIERSGPDDLFEELPRYEPLLRTEGDFLSAIEPFKEWVFYLGAHGRSVLGEGPLPLSDGYYLGGWGSLRGYREEQFAAEHIAWLNLEWRAMLGPDAHGFIFLDSGVIRPSGGDYDYKFGYGLGIRLSTAIGRWDISYGIGEGGSLTGGLIHIGLRTGF